MVENKQHEGRERNEKHDNYFKKGNKLMEGDRKEGPRNEKE